jgi:cysteinyl-tRNA synthetase
MHNGFIRVDNEKMSKSLGNFFTIREVLARFDPEVVRFFIARTHYRSPINYSDHNLEDAKHALTRLYTALRGIPAAAAEVDWNEVHAKRFHEAMNDDFNTSEAVAVLFDLATELNRTRDASVAKLLKSLAAILGLLQRDPVEFLQGRSHVITPDTGNLRTTEHAPAVSVGPSPEEIEARIAERAAAKKAKNYGEADRIRKGLLDLGVVLEDSAQGTTWRRS